MRRQFCTAAVAATFVAAAAAWAPAAWAQAKPPVRIAAIVPLSGAGTFDGQLTLEGIQAAANLINAKGGILGGRQLEILPYDDKSSPEEGVSAARRAIERDKVDAIAGNFFSSVALAMKEVTRDKMLHMVLASQHPNITKEGHKYLFRINETADMRGKNFNDFMCKKMNLKSVAILASNDDLGRLIAADTAKGLAACGVEIRGTEYFQLTDVDFTIQATKLRGLNPTAVYVVAGATSQGATIYRQFKQLGYRGTLIASGGNMNPKLIELAGPAVEGVFSISPYVEDQPNAAAERWRKEYTSKFKNAPSFVASLGAAGLESITQAMDKAGSSTDYAAIAKALRSTNFDTVLGPVRYDEQGQGYIASYIVRVKDGKIVTHARAN